MTLLTNSYTTTTSINTSLATKQDTITAGTGLKFSGATLATYKLHGNGTQTTSPIDDLMFNNLSCSEVINLQTQRYEFKVEGLGLRWNTNSTPSSTIQDIHFKSGLTIAEALNLSSGHVELTVEHPANHPVSMITGLQARLDTIDKLFNTASS